MNPETFNSGQWVRAKQFLRFCIVGFSGVIVDMTVLYVLADSDTLAANATVAKVFSAEVAMLNNFWWNEVWTFRGGAGHCQNGMLFRLLRFNAICGIGIGLAVLFLYLFHTFFGLDLYLANLVSILLVTIWNYWMNAKFNWCVNVR